MSRLLFIALLTWLAPSCNNSMWAQEASDYNLIRPYSKIYSPSPSVNPGEIERTRDWFSPFGPSADLISKKGYYPGHLPKIFYFDHYLGLNLYSPKKYTNRTFATIRMNHELEAGEIYRFKLQGFFPFYEEKVNEYLKEELEIYPRDPNPMNEYRLRRAQMQFRNIPLGVSLTKSKPTTINDIAPIAEKHVIKADGYFEFNYEYTAQGGEKYLTIGNPFQKNELPKEILFGMDKYVLVSKVSLSKKNVDNLIPNGGFEEVTAPPNDYGQWWRLKNWFSPHPNREFNPIDPSPDLYFRGLGYDPPLKGNGSGRVGYINMDTVQFNEGLSVKLSKPLEKGKRYGLSYLVEAVNKPKDNFLIFEPKHVKSDLDSLKVQFGLSKSRPKQGYNEVLRAEKVFTISSKLSFVTQIRSGMITFTADSDYEYLTFGYFYELDVPVWTNSPLGVIMDELYLYEIPEEPIAFQEDQNEQPVAILPDKEVSNPVITPNPEAPEGDDQELFDPLNLPDNQDVSKPAKPVDAIVYNDSIDLDMPQVRLEKRGQDFPEIAKLKSLEKDISLRLKHEAEVKTPNCRLIVYDHQTEDGDIVTLKLNQQTLAEHLEIRRQPNVHIFDVVMDKGENYIYPIAENLGRIPPNTIKIDVVCGRDIQRFVLFSEPGSSEVLKVDLK